MSPDISTRCLQCGAAVRPDALFCPECGRPSNQDERSKREADSDSAVDGEVEEVDEVAEENDTTAGASVEPPASIEPAESAPASADPLPERLAKLKAEAEVSPTVVQEVEKATVPDITVPSLPKKRSQPGGRVVASSRRSSKWAALAKPAKGLTVDPALRFLLVTAGLVVFSLLVYLLSRYVK